MRRQKRAASEELARKLISEAEVLHLASITPEGAPVLRALNGVLVRDWILFHGAFAGEKSSCLEMPGVVSAHEIVADIPSYFVDPDKACPATTYYRSAQAHGRLQDVTEHDLKVEMLTELMRKYQPEGGHEPFSSKIYDKDQRSVRVFGLKIEKVSAKLSLGQDRPAERTRQVVAGLWERGKVRDLPAIEAILELSPGARPSEWKRHQEQEELYLVVHPSVSDIQTHAKLLEGKYWRLQSSLQDIETSIGKSDAWVGVRTNSDVLIGAARATSDETWVANVFDVVVCEDFRGRGVGQWMMDVLLRHPAVRAAPRQKLGTKDAMSFYEKFGFQVVESPDPLLRSVQMLRQSNEVGLELSR